MHIENVFANTFAGGLVKKVFGENPL